MAGKVFRKERDPKNLRRARRLLKRSDKETSEIKDHTIQSASNEFTTS